MQKIFNTSTTYLLFEIVSVFIYSLIKYVVKIEPCYSCLEHTMYNTHSLRQSYIVYEFRFPGSTVKLHYCKAHTQYILNLIIFYWFRNLYTKTSLDALSVPNWLHYTVSAELVHMMKIHVQHQLIMPQMLTAAGWNYSSVSFFSYSMSVISKEAS